MITPITQRMKPLKNKVLVSVNLTQKSDYEIELTKGVNLWMDSNFGADGRITNPCIATVVHPGGTEGLLKDDIILCHHNTFNMGAISGNLLGDTKEKDEKGYSLFVIDPNLIYIRIREGEFTPLDGYMIVERIKKEQDSVIIKPDSNEPNRFKVVKAGVGCDPVKEGDIVVCFKYSDYEIEYNLDKKKRSVIRVKIDDVLGIEN